MKKILYIDDESEAEKMKSKFEILEDYNIKIDSKADLSDILKTISKPLDHYSLIVVDMIMAPKGFLSIEETNGGMVTGLALIKKIRNKNQNIPIIIFSIRSEKEFDPDLMKKHNIAGFYQKTLSAYDLKDAILKNAK